jgi:hypothetical protein
MRKYYGIIILLFIFFDEMVSQDLIRINGYILDSLSNKPLISAPVSIENSGRGALTNQYGWFTLEINQKEKNSIIINYIGYRQKKITYRDYINKDMPIYIKLQEKPVMTNEVIVESDLIKGKSLTESGYQQLTYKEISHIPSIGGESDITKIMQLLPGVNTSSEGSARLNVRGGEQNQNLILIDGAEVYNPMHILGYFSSFNTDAINSMELYKGYISPQYSGKLSSVTNIFLKDGNSNENKYSGGISILSSQFMLEGPLGSNNSYMFSARRTYLDPILNLLGVGDFRYSFYDIYSKISFQLSTGDRLFISSYFGNDRYDANVYEGSDNKIKWGNLAGNIRYNRVWNSSLFSDISVIYSKYSSEFYWGGTYKNPYLQDLSLKMTADYDVNPDFSLKMGGNLRYYDFNVTSGLQDYNNNRSFKSNALEYEIFINSNNKVTSRIETNTGINVSVFNENITESHFNYIEPRFGISYYIDENTTLKSSYILMHQYIHMLSSTSYFAPNDIFYPSYKNLPPMEGSQVSIGFSRLIKFNDGMYELDADVYYKDMKKIPMFRHDFNDADPLTLPTEIYTGKGWGYGAEIQITKREGKLNGWINYTWNKAYRLFNYVNKDRAFVPKFWREHQMNLVMNYRLSGSVSLGAAFVLASGQAITLPANRFYILGVPIENFNNQLAQIDYGEINGYRLPLYNRLDLSLVHYFNMWGGNWELFCSVYNIYNYKNPTFLTFSQYQGKFFSTTIGILPTFGLKFYY